MSAETCERVALGDAQIDLRYRRVLRGEDSVELTPRVFDLLRVFMAEPGVLHTRERLMERVWPGVVVEDANLSQSVWMLRRALGDHDRRLIRTVSKRGYVFEPPTPSAASESAAPVAAPAEDALELALEAAESLPARARPSWRPRFAAAALLFLLGATFAWLMWPQATPAVRSVRVLATPSAAAPEQAAALALLCERLQWQLRGAPGWNLLGGDDVLAESQAQAADVVLLLSAHAGADARMMLAVQVVGDGARGQLLQQSAPVAELAGLTAALADLSLEALAADPPAAAFPDPGAGALAHGRGLAARAQHRQAEAVAAFEEALGLQPAFAPAALELARAQSELGRHGAAAENAGRAAAWVESLPEGSQRLALQAQLAEFRQQHVEAAAIWARLAQADGDVEHRLAQARDLLRARDVGQALATLAAIPHEGLADIQRARLLLTEAEARLGAGQAAPAAALAAQAAELAHSLGWTHGLGQGRFHQARALAFQGSDVEGDRARFEAAARAFREAGDELGALRAEMTGEVLAVRHDHDSALRRSEELIARARADGNLRLEVEGLTLLATVAMMAGDAARHGQLLEQASAAAGSAGDFATVRVLQAELAQRDLLDGRIVDARERLQLVLRHQPRGFEALRVHTRLASVQLRLGDLAGAAASAVAADALVGADTDPGFAATLRCHQGTLGLMRGQVDEALHRFDQCARQARPELQAFAVLGRGTVAALRGEREPARAALAQAAAQLQSMPPGPARLNLELAYAELAGRVDLAADARARYESGLAALGRGPRLFAALARVGIAECALELGERESAQAALLAADADAPDQDWSLLLRRRVLHARLDGDAAALAALAADAQARGDVYGEMVALDAQLRLPSADAHPEAHARLAELAARSGYSRVGIAGAVAAR